jgi:hypothetical protein
MNHRNSMLKWGAIALLGAVAVGIGWDSFFDRAANGSSLQADRQGAAEDVTAESLEVEQRAPAALAPQDPDSLARGEVAERAAVGEPAPVEEQPAESSALSIPLHGVVLDPLGRTVPDVIVEWVADPKALATEEPAPPTGSQGPQIGGPGRFGRGGVAPSTQGPGGFLSSSQDLGTVIRLDELNGWSRRGSIHPRVQTDANGPFEFPDVPARSEGTLRFGHQLFAGTPPSRPPATPLVRIDLRDAQTGRELFPERVQPRLVGLPSVLLDAEGRELPRRALKEPRSDQLAWGMGWVELQRSGRAPGSSS